MRFLSGFVFAIVVAAIAALGVAYSGIVNVTARGADSAPLAWFLATAKRQSVMRQAAAEATPPASNDLKLGFRLYNETCVYCHGGPGKDPVDFGKGLMPEPPYLADTVAGWSPGQLYWIVRNGIRMTGMPSFADTHSEDELRAVVAFIQRLPGMTPEQYAEYERGQ